MITLTGMLKFAGKAFLQILKTAVSFATGTVAAFFLFLGWAQMLYRISQTDPQPLRFRWMSTAYVFAGKYVGLAAFAGGFYLTFKLLEPRMAARKKLFVAALGIVLPLVSLFTLSYKPTLGTAEFSQKASSPGPPKPYEEAIYDVYSDLLKAERTQRSLWQKVTDPIPEGVLIRIDTTIETGPGRGPGFGPNPASLPGNIMPQEQLDKAVSSAAADYARRNRESFQLQRKFSLPKYDLITTAEEHAALESCRLDQEGCREFVRKHHDYYRWVELSAVGFNEDQTVAYLYMVEWRGGFGRGGHRTLYKRNGEWRLVEATGFADWAT